MRSLSMTKKISWEECIGTREEACEKGEELADRSRKGGEGRKGGGCGDFHIEACLEHVRYEMRLPGDGPVILA